jgi:hypothetical protein
MRGDKGTSTAHRHGLDSTTDSDRAKTFYETALQLPDDRHHDRDRRGKEPPGPPAEHTTP